MNTNSTRYAPAYATVSSTNRGGALLMVNIVGLIVSLASVAVRLFISTLQSKKGFAVYKDDLLCFAALVCIPQQVKMHICANMALITRPAVSFSLRWYGPA
jgi:hypothetical protein